MKTSKFYFFPLVFILITVLFPIRTEAQKWYSNCASIPASLNSSNASTMALKECRLTAVKAQLNGMEGFLHTYEFRRGPRIRIFGLFSRNSAIEQVHYSTGDRPWSSGWLHWQEFFHECDSYTCYWTIIKDDNGNIILGTATSI